MKKQLPSQPSFEQLKKQAKDLLKSHQSSDSTAKQRITESHPRLSGASEVDIRAAKFTLSDAQLVILDEPTASLDARAEDEFFRRFRSESTGPMAVLISHRLSTVRMADKIVVLEHGKIREEGTHGDLLRLGGHYAELFKLQAAAFLEDEPNTTGCIDSQLLFADRNASMEMAHSNAKQDSD